MTDSLTNHIIGKRYRLISEIVEGSFGKIYSGKTDIAKNIDNSDKEYAVKMVLIRRSIRRD